MVIPFATAHLDQIVLPAEYEYLKAGNARTLRFLAAYDLASTIVSADYQKVIAICGAVIPSLAEECEVFIFPSADLKRQSVTFWRSLRQEIGRMRTRFDTIRAIGSDTEVSRRFLSRLGFSYEGRVKRSGCHGKLMWYMKGNA